MDLTVDGKKVDPNSFGINTDIEKAQVITKDEKIDLIDVELQTDLINKDERQELKDAKDKLKDYGETIVDTYNHYFKDDNENSASISENYKLNRFTTRAVNVIKEDEELSEALKNIKEYSEEDQLVIINQVMKKMYLANGFSNYPIIKVEDLENAIATRGTNTGIIFVDIKKLSSLSSKEILGTLIHETTHGLKYGEVAEDYTVE